MKCALYLAHNTPPFGMIREIRTATDIDRIRPLDTPGRMSFRVSQAEGVANEGIMAGTGLEDGSPIGPDVLREGSAVIDYSTEGIEPWLWFIRRIAYGSDGLAEVEAVEWRQLLFERQIPLRTASKTRSAGAFGRDILAAVNSRNPTHIRPHLPLGGMTRMLSPIPINLGGMMLGAALDEAAFRSNTEWFVHYHIAWRICEPTLHWVYRRGSDLSGRVHLTEGVHLTSVVYARDAREVPRIVRFVEGGGIVPGASVGASAPAQLVRSDSGRFETAPVADQRAISRNQHGPALQTEVLEVMPQGGGSAAMLMAALRRLQVPIVALQSVELTLRNTRPVLDDAGIAWLNPLPVWSSFDLGDTITVRLASPHFIGGVDLVVRVMAIQPDEASGELVMVAEVQS